MSEVLEHSIRHCRASWVSVGFFCGLKSCSLREAPQMHNDSWASMGLRKAPQSSVGLPSAAKGPKGLQVIPLRCPTFPRQLWQQNRSQDS